MRALVAVLALATAMPVISIPTYSDAQVLTGRRGVGGASRPRRAQPPRLSTTEQQQLWDAQDLVVELNGQIENLQAAGAAAGGLTEAQRTEIAGHTTRRDEAQATVDRLVAKRGA
ncbi:MAG: hypothetical protein EON94_08880 [Caulobacteraceae bacterium]|nr:MAG: hypothetical protein EON94_08880 [Caulobacteraceae bacterium]